MLITCFIGNDYLMVVLHQVCPTINLGYQKNEKFQLFKIKWQL